MFVNRLLMGAAMAVALVAASPAVPQALPSGGVLVQGLNGLHPHHHTLNCMPEMRDDRFRCVLGYGQFAHLTFTYQKNTADGCTFVVRNVGSQTAGDVFKIERLRNQFTRRCGTNHKDQRHLEVLPTH